MKKIYYLCAAAAAAIAVSACSLDESPYAVSAELLAGSESGAEQLVTGIYSSFWSSYMMKKTYMEWIDMDHDHSAAESWVVTGTGEGNVTTHWGYNGSSDLWNAFYMMISRSNKAIETFRSGGKIDSDRTVGQFYGECLFMRAWAYFHIVRMYGPAPLRLTYLQQNDMKRSPVTEVADQIVADLNEAILYMSYPSEGGVGAWGHPDKTAAQLLLAKVYCTMGSYSLAANGISMAVDVKKQDDNPDGLKTERMTFNSDKEATAGWASIDAADCYSKALVLCDTILGRKGVDFDLMPRFTDVWGSNNARNKELIWGVSSCTNTDYQPQHLHYYYTPVPFGGRARYAGVAPHLYSQYESTDDRQVYGFFHWFCLYGSQVAQGWVPFPSSAEFPAEAMPDNLKSYTGWYGDSANKGAYITKWYNGDLTNLEPRKKNAAGAVEADAANNQDIPLLRFAEVYLLRAEALVELGRTDEAVESLNVIRERNNASIYGKGLTKQEARSFVFKERGLEFLQEFNRKFDLLRWGLYLDVMNNTLLVRHNNFEISKVRERRCLLYAVPTAEVNENHLFGGNNFGW